MRMRMRMRNDEAFNIQSGSKHAIDNHSSTPQLHFYLVSMTKSLLTVYLCSLKRANTTDKTDQSDTGFQGIDHPLLQSVKLVCF